MWQEIPDDAICANCHKRKATIKWIGDGGIMAMTHGWVAFWCEFCATKINLKYARKQAERIPKLEKKLKGLKGLE